MARIFLRSLEERDRAALISLLLDETVSKTYLVPELTGPDDPAAARMFERIAELSHDESRYVRGIFLNETFIGLLNDCGITGSEIELGWALLPAWHNRGYCTEAAKAAIAELFDRGYTRVTAGAFEENRASLRVMEKCGMTPTGETETLTYRGKEHRVIVCAIEKQE